MVRRATSPQPNAQQGAQFVESGLWRHDFDRRHPHDIRAVFRLRPTIVEEHHATGVDVQPAEERSHRSADPVCSRPLGLIPRRHRSEPRALWRVRSRASCSSGHRPGIRRGAGWSTALSMTGRTTAAWLMLPRRYLASTRYPCRAHSTSNAATNSSRRMRPCSCRAQAPEEPVSATTRLMKPTGAFRLPPRIRRSPPWATPGRRHPDRRARHGRTSRRTIATVETSSGSGNGTAVRRTMRP